MQAFFYACTFLSFAAFLVVSKDEAELSVLHIVCFGTA